MNDFRRTTLLDHNARAVAAELKALSRAELEELLEAELAGKARSSVILAIKGRMNLLLIAERKAIAAADALARG